MYCYKMSSEQTNIYGSYKPLELNDHIPQPESPFHPRLWAEKPRVHLEHFSNKRRRERVSKEGGISVLNDS